MSIIHWIGIDDHADNWTIAEYVNREDKPAKQWVLIPDEKGYRQLIKWLRQLSGEVHVVYEAGPCGYELYRRLSAAGINCVVAAPSLTPIKPGQRVKTNRRDACKLARYLRAGELTLVYVPDVDREFVRDLVRARHAVQKDLTRVSNQILKFLLRHGHRYRDGDPWTGKFFTWLRSLDISNGNGAFVLEQLLLARTQRLAQLVAYDEQIALAAQLPEFAPFVEALGALRGVGTLTAMTILSELGDLRRFASAPQLMSAVGLVPSESSTGNSVNRFSITKTGNSHVRHVSVEAGWQYKGRITNGRRITQRRKNLPPALIAIAERCDQRLHRKFGRMSSRGKPSTVTVVAVARELLGFAWAIIQALEI